MGFQHPNQKHHKLQGMAKAAQSPNTPAHLRQHLAKQVGANMRVDNLRKPSGKVPRQNILRSTVPAQSALEPPQDEQPFETQPKANDISPMGAKVGSITKQPSPAGTRPMSVSASLPKRTGPGIVASQSAVVRKPFASGLNQDRKSTRLNSSHLGISYAV